MVYVFVAFWLLLGIGVFFVAMRGGGRGAREGAAAGEAVRESKAGHRLVMLGAAIAIAFGVVVPALILVHNGNDKASEAVGGVHQTAAATRGRELFAHSCVFCHTLEAVKSQGRIGPNLDIHVGDDISTYAGRRALVESAILEGRARGKGDMPALLYQGREAEDVAEFVAAVAGH